MNKLTKENFLDFIALLEDGDSYKSFEYCNRKLNNQRAIGLIDLNDDMSFSSYEPKTGITPLCSIGGCQGLVYFMEEFFILDDLINKGRIIFEKQMIEDFHEFYNMFMFQAKLNQDLQMKKEENKKVKI